MDDKQTTLDLFEDDFNILDEIEVLRNEEDFEVEKEVEEVSVEEFSNNEIDDDLGFEFDKRQNETDLDLQTSFEELNNLNSEIEEPVLSDLEEFDTNLDNTSNKTNDTDDRTIVFEPIKSNDSEIFSGLNANPIDESNINIAQPEEVKMSIEENLLNNDVEYGKVNIMVIGVGGCGCNVINRMHAEKFDGIKIVGIDTSQQSLDTISADYKLLIGEKVFSGHGSGGNTEKVEEVFKDEKDKIRNLLRGVDMLFLAGGIGLGTGSVGLVEIGKISREMGVLTIGFATLPTAIQRTTEILKKYYPQFIESVDSNIIVENDKISKFASNLPLSEAIQLADSMLIEGITGIFELITKPGKINLDYADIRTAFSNQGSCIMGIGKAKGEGAVLKAIEASVHSEIANVESIKNAKTIIFNITCKPRSITIDEASKGCDSIYSFGYKDSIEHLLFGYSYDESLEDEVKVTFIATGTKPVDMHFEDNETKFTQTNTVFEPVKQNKKEQMFDEVVTGLEEEVISTGKPVDMPDFFKK